MVAPGEASRRPRAIASRPPCRPSTPTKMFVNIWLLRIACPDTDGRLAVSLPHPPCGTAWLRSHTDVCCGMGEMCGVGQNHDHDDSDRIRAKPSLRRRALPDRPVVARRQLSVGGPDLSA